MDCLIIFDHMNDVVFSKYSEPFEEHIKHLALAEGLLTEESVKEPIHRNILIQCFSPVVTSHRIMHCQFGNSYTQMKFDGKLKMFFNEFMGYLFVVLTEDREQNFINICISFVRYLCGPDIYQLYQDDQKSFLLSRLIDSWLDLQKDDQAVFVEAVEQLIVNSTIASTCHQTLKDSVGKLGANPDFSRAHVLLLVQNKFLSLSSSSAAKQLSPSDIMFTIILGHCRRNDENLSSHQVLLAGPEADPKCLPHAVHIIEIYDGVNLVNLIEIGDFNVAASLYETFCHLHVIQGVQIQRDKDTLQLAFENLDLAVKKLNTSFKKNKNSSIEASHKQLVKKWDVIKKKYQEYLKNGSEEAILRAETLLLGFLENLKELLNLTHIDNSILELSREIVLTLSEKVKENMEVFREFLIVKSDKNFALGPTDSLTINKYLEEFPGLVHFLFVDRKTHRVTYPNINFETEKEKFLKNKVWSLIRISRKHLQEGHTSMIWKDTAYTYGYFLWFEDHTGASLKATNPSSMLSHVPGILGDNFYEKLKDVYFPKTAPSKIRYYELFCVHLGLVTPSCVLEQARRLAATIWELKGFPAHMSDLL